MKKIVASSFFILLFWALFVPAFEFPDEQQHFATVSLLADSNQMPQKKDPDLSVELETTQKTLKIYRDERGNNFYTYHPENKINYSNAIYGPEEQLILDSNTSANRSTHTKQEAAIYPKLYYGYESLFYQSVSKFSILDRLFIARLGSVLLGALTVYVAYKIGYEIFRDQSKAKALAILLALQPMMSFVMSGVNSDTLHILLFSLIIFYCLRLLRTRASADVVFNLVVVTFLDFLTKPQAYIALPIIVTALVLRGIIRKEITATIKIIILLSLIGLATGYFLDRGTVTALFTKGKIPFTSTLIHPAAPTFIDHLKYSINQLVRQNIVWYWGVFKWLGVVLPRPFWWAANRLVVIAGIGVFWKMIKTKSTLVRSQIILLAIISFIYAAAIFTFDWQYVRATSIPVAVQARYYFPTITAHMALLVIGISGLVRKEKHKQLLIKTLVGFFILLQFAGIYTIANSYYDTSTPSSLFIQASQYKPIFAKGYSWIVWATTYLFGVSCLATQAIKKNTD